MAIKLNGKRISKNTENILKSVQKIWEQRNPKETTQEAYERITAEARKRLPEDLGTYKYNYAPPSLQESGNFAGGIKGVSQQSSGKMYSLALDEERKKAELKKKQNAAANLRNIGKKYGSLISDISQVDGKVTGVTPSGFNPAANKLTRALANDTVNQLDKQIENEINIIHNQGRAEDSPEVQNAQETLADLMDRRTSAQQTLAQTKAPTYVGKKETGQHLTYSPEANEYIKKIQELNASAGKRLTEKGITRFPGGMKVEGQIPKVVSKEYGEYQHMINTPESETSADYVEWLKEGRDIGLYNTQQLNAMMAGVGNKTVADEYAGMDASKKSSWLNLKDQDMLHWNNAMDWWKEHPEGSDAEALEAMRKYYHDELASRYYNDEEFWQDEREAAQNRLATLTGRWLQYAPEGERMPVNIMGRKGNYETPEQMARMDELLYDSVMGQGAYQREIASYEGTTYRDEHMRELNNRISRAWDYYEQANPYEQGSRDELFNILTGRDAEHDAERVETLGSERRYLTDKIKEIEDKQNYYNKVKEYKAGYQDYAGENSTEDDESFDKGKYNPNDYRFTLAEKGSNNVDDIYSFIIGGKERQSYVEATANGWGETPPNISKDYKGAMLLQPDEINIFKNLYESGKKDEAMAFLDGLQFAIDSRYLPFEEVQTREEARAFPILSSVFAQGANVMNTALGGMTMLDAALTSAGVDFGENDAAKNPASIAYAPVRYAEATQDEIASMLGPEGGKLYLQSMNSIRNVINGVLMYKLGIPEGMLPTATLATFGTQIYQEQMYNYLKDNYDFDKASALATLDTALEIGEELLPIETMFATAGGSLFVRIISNILSEMGEEFAGATVGKVLRGAITGRNEWEKREDQIYNEGGYLDDNGEWVKVFRGKQGLAEAEKQALREWGKEIVEGTLAGGFGGAFGAAYGGITNANQQRKVGARIQSENNNAGTLTGTDQLVKAAQGMAEGTESRRIADKIAEKLQNGGMASNYQVGKLVFAMSTESNGIVSDIAQKTLEQHAREQLAREGVDADMIDRVAPIVAKAATNGTKSLTIKERIDLSTSRNAIDLLKSYLADDGTLAAEISKNKEVETATKVNRAIRELLSDRKGNFGEKVSKDILSAAETANVANQDDIENAYQKRIESGVKQGMDELAATISDGTHAIVNDEVVQVVDINKDGVVVEHEDGTTETVKPENVVAGNKKLGTLISYGVQNNVIGSKGFQAIINGIGKNTKAGDGQYIGEAIRTYIAGRVLGQQPNTTLNQETADAIWQAAEEDNAQANKDRLATGQIEVTPGEGTAEFDGVQHGTEKWDRKLKDAGLTKQQRTQADTVAEYAERLGFHVNFVNNPDMEAEFGWEDKATGRITINLAGKNADYTIGGKKYSGENHHLMVTAAHEFTHWLEQNSPEQYNELRQFVFDKLRREGQDIEALAMRKMDLYRLAKQNGANVQELDLEGAMAEIVANACDQVLGSEKVAAEIEQTSPTLYAKVKEFVTNLVDKIREAAAGMDRSMSYESRLLQNWADELQDHWLNTLKEAQSREQGPEEAQEGAQKKFSINELGMEDISAQDAENIASRGGIIVDNVNDMITAINEARNSNKQKNIFLGIIDNATKEALRKETGNDNLFRDGDYAFGFSYDNVRHFDKHFDTDDDVAGAIIEVYRMFKDHDTAEAITDETNRTKLVLTKAENVYEFLGVADLSRRSRNAIVKSVYLTRGNIKNWRSLNPAVSLRNDTNYAGSLLPNENIPQNENSVKSFSLQENDPEFDRLYEAADQARKTWEDLRKQYNQLTKGEEYTAWVDRITEAQKAGNTDELLKEYRQWELDNDISGLSKRVQDAERAKRETEKALDNYIKQRDIANEEKAIKDSGLNEADWRRKQAVNEFGYTTNFNEAGYLLPNGKLLNFVGEKGRHTGSRGQDHRAIETIYAAKERGDAMVAFMTDGNIRVIAETPGIDIISTVEPTPEQYAMIRRMAERYADEEYFNVDFTDENGNTVDSIEYEGRVNGTKIENDIKTFYKTGEAPQQSLVSQFHYSIRDEGDMEINRWMQGLTASSLQTEQERVMLQQWQGINGGLNVARYALNEQRQKLRQLEAKQNPTAYDRNEMQKTRNRIEIWQKKVDRYEQQMVKATSEKGFAAMMYRQSRIMNDLVNGRTEDEVHATVDAINAALEQVQKEMAERSERLKDLANREAVIRIRQQLNSAGLKRIAAKLKADMNSELSNTEIENRLALMALKMKEGRVDEEDVTELADMLIGKMRRTYDSYILDTLRGTTITLSKSQLQELKAQNSSLREVRQELAGTGIRIDTKGSNTLDKNWAELCRMIPALDEGTADKDMLGQLLNVIAAEKEASRQQYAQDMDMQVATMVIDAASELVPEIVTDKKSLQLIRETLGFIADMSREAGESAKAMDELNSLMDRLQKKGKEAKSTLGRLEGNIRDAIEYNNALAKQSEAATWTSERHKLINQLNDEHTKEMLRQQEEFRQKIEKEKTARKLQADNMALRRRINTNISRMRKLLIHETTKDNVPEYLKGLTRTVLAEIVNNDMTGRKITGMSQEDLTETARVLAAMEAQDGAYNPDELKNMDEAVQDVLFNALEDIRAGIDFYNASTKGNDIQVNLQGFKNALTRISDGVSAIASIINAERSIALGDRRVAVQDQAYKVQESTGDRKFRERTGKVGMAINALHKAVISGNLTPEYFFKMLKNAGLNDLWEEYHRAENRNGLELAKAKARLAEIADKYGYANWDMNQRVTVPLASGDVKMTIGQLMALQATWKREHTLGPAMSNHLGQGGFYVEEFDPREGIYGRQVVDRKAHRVTDADMQKVQGMLTQEQLDFVDAVVEYMSTDMSELGNEASMKAYGIKMYKEAYYYPFKMWDGVKSRASNDSGSAAKQDRAFHPSFSKTRLHGANNAVILGDFMQTATDHIVGMINYATMGLANENLQKVLNQQVPEGERLDMMTKRNIRTVIEEAYGKEAMQYLAKLQEQLNGGAVQVERSLGDRALSLFRKNAVAGSLSVAAQQPLSYIRAAMMLNPKYLSEALVKEYWKDSYKQRLEHSGVSVIKDMGRFDMGFGQSAREFLTPEGKEKTAAKVWNEITDKATILPELMDRWTWNRLWVAVKAEQHDQNQDMDVNSDEFLDKCGERFNDIVRKTQVYDSVLTKSQNMRSQNYFTKSITSFMAEPTLSLNVLADAIQNAGEKGGKTKLAKAGATFLLSAAMQAAVKGLMSSGRSPDDKKTWEENFLYRLYANLLQEVDPLNLVPGYNDVVTLLKKGELEDDALGMAGKLWTAWDKSKKLFTEGFNYRTVEDSVAQLAQLFTNLPAKNLMRDARAMYNFFTNEPYAKRETSQAVLKLQAEANLMNADNLASVLYSKLVEGGYKTSNTAYYGRMYNAMKNGNTQAAEDIKEYLKLIKDQDDSKIASGLRAAAKKDESKTAAEQDQWMIDNDLMDKDNISTITKQYKDGEISEAEAKKLYKAANPELTDDDVWWKIDRINWQKQTGAEEAPGGEYYRLGPALETNRSADIKEAIDTLLKHGKTKENVKTQLTKELKQKYLDADSNGKVKIRNELQTAYKALGYTAADADKIIEGWKKDAQKKK